MAKTDVWMPLYIGDYLADTMDLTTEQHGAYLLLIMAYWRNGGPISSDPVRLAAICRMTQDAWSNAQAMLMQFFDHATPGVWRHKRVEEELANSHQKKAKAAEKAKKAASARWNNAPSNPQAMHKECPSPSPSPSPSDNTAFKDIDAQQAEASPPSVKRKCRIPKDFELTTERIRAATDYWGSKGRQDLSASDEFDKFVNYFTGNGKPMLDWDACWKTWYTNALQFNRAAIRSISNQPKTIEQFRDETAARAERIALAVQEGKL